MKIQQTYLLTVTLLCFSLITETALGTEYPCTLCVYPIYPARALSKGISGKVLVEFTVRADGLVRDPVVLESTDSLFERSAVRVMLKNRYGVPRGYDGTPDETLRLRAIVSFDPNGKSGPGNATTEKITLDDSNREKPKLASELDISEIKVADEVRTPSSIDDESYPSVFGLRVGMSPDQVIASIKRRYPELTLVQLVEPGDNTKTYRRIGGVTAQLSARRTFRRDGLDNIPLSPKRIKLLAGKPLAELELTKCTSERITASDTKSCISTLRFTVMVNDSESYGLQVFFVENYPSEPSTTLVTNLAFSHSHAQLAFDSRAFVKERYGITNSEVKLPSAIGNVEISYSKAHYGYTIRQFARALQGKLYGATEKAYYDAKRNATKKAEKPF